MSLIRTIWKWVKFPFVFLIALARENPIIACLILALVMITVPSYLLGKQIHKNAEQTEQIENLSKQNTRAIAKINREKIERRQGQDNINTYVCQTNDAQDILLAKLVAVAVNILNEQQVAQDRDAEGKTVFEQALVQLRNSPECAVIVEKLKTDPEVGSRSKESKKGPRP